MTLEEQSKIEHLYFDEKLDPQEIAEELKIDICKVLAYVQYMQSIKDHKKGNEPKFDDDMEYIDYEKKYKEALERARLEMSKDGMKNDVIAIHLTETIFPELKRDENEMIREELIKHLKEGAEGYEPAGGSRDYKQWLAWVEKQDELVNSLSKGLDNAHERIDKLIQKNNELCGKLEKQSEKKPYGLNEYDEQNIKDLESVLFYDKNLPHDTRLRLNDWLMSLKERL